MLELSGLGITEAIVSLAGVFLSYVGKRVLEFLKEQKEIDEAYKAGITALLRAEIVRGAKHYCKRGKISVSARSCLCDMYDTYHKLGGNGFVTRWYERIRELPHDDEEKYD